MENQNQLVDFKVEVEDGRDVRVLQLTDPQIIDEQQQRYIKRLTSNPMGGLEYESHEKYVKQVIEIYRPDFIIVTGDVIYGEFDDTGFQFLRYVDFMDSFGIPWAPVFGNHDNESNMGVDWQCEQFQNARYCLFKQNDLTGNGNYSVGLYQNQILKRVFFMLDSNGCGAASFMSLSNGQTQPTPGFGSDQIEWYTKSINAIRAVEANVKISFAFHIQLKVFADALEKYDFTNEGTFNKPINIDTHPKKEECDFGYIGNDLKGAWDEDYIVWNSLKDLGVDSIFVGHEHLNSASVVYEGVRLQYGLKSSTCDRHNRLRPNGDIGIEGEGDPLVGGTAIIISQASGVISDCYHIYYDKTKETEGYIHTGSDCKTLLDKYAYCQYTLSDLGREEIELEKGRKEIFEINSKSFSITFNYKQLENKGLEIRLLTGESGNGGLFFRFTDSQVVIVDKVTIFEYPISISEDTMIEVGVIQYAEDEQSGICNGNTGHLFVRINGRLNQMWRIVELWNYKNNKWISFSGSGFVLYN